jgi:hypothetical protein
MVKTRTRKNQKMYNMKGCSHKHGSKMCLEGKCSHKHGSKMCLEDKCSKCGSKMCLEGKCSKCGAPCHKGCCNFRGGSGCAGCTSCTGTGTSSGISFPPILGIAQTGGCDTCLRGGGFYKPAAPVPPPFVGSPWGAKVSEWPGVDGSRNYFTDNLYKNDPQTMMKLGGTKRRKGSRSGTKRRLGKGRGKKSINGGSSFQDITNLGRDLSFNFQSAYNSLNGYKQPVNPAPYADQFSRTYDSSI